MFLRRALELSPVSFLFDTTKSVVCAASQRVRLYYVEGLGDDDIACTELGPHLEVKTCDRFRLKTINRRLQTETGHRFLPLSVGAKLSDRLRRWSNKPDVVGSIPDTTEFFLIISCDSNQVPKWFGTHYYLQVPL